MKVVRNILIVLVVLCLVFFTVSLGLVGLRTMDNKIYYQDVINKYAEEYSADPMMIASIISVESDFRADAVSGMGARGLMQILPETGQWIADRMEVDFEEDLLFDPDYNVKLGAYYYEYLYEYYGDEALALAAYNGGMGNVDSWLDNPDYSKDGRTLDTIPFQETRDYVGKVGSAYENYRFFYGRDLPEEDSNWDLIWSNYKTFIGGIGKNF